MKSIIRISEGRAGGRALVRISGRILSGAAAGRLLRSVRAALARGRRDLTIDLAGLAAIDCGGIGALILCLQDAARCGATVRVARTRGRIRSMLALSALLDPLEKGRLASEGMRRLSGRDVPLLIPA